jgi:hypothetical protein
MKKTFPAFLFLATSLFAQSPGHQPNPTNIVARLTTVLGLSAAQQTQATAIFTNEQTALEPIRTNIQTDHTNLAAAIKKNDTATIDTLSAQLGTYSAQISDITSKAQAAFYAILTADQQTKYDSLHGPGGFGGLGGFGGAAMRGARSQQ